MRQGLVAYSCDEALRKYVQFFVSVKSKPEKGGPLKQTLIGIVTSTKSSKTLRVEVPRKVRHPLYGKIVSQRTICHAHDENEEAQVDDRVEIVESRPHSRLKRWELVKVLSRH
jgi:small subunit ribosomal protein S17